MPITTLLIKDMHNAHQQHVAATQPTQNGPTLNFNTASSAQDKPKMMWWRQRNAATIQQPNVLLHRRHESLNDVVGGESKRNGPNHSTAHHHCRNKHNAHAYKVRTIFGGSRSIPPMFLHKAEAKPQKRRPSIEARGPLDTLFRSDPTQTTQTVGVPVPPLLSFSMPALSCFAASWV